MENAKPEFARRGAEKQRPKSWNKGTKSGSEKRKMREEGKRASRDIHEDLTPEKRQELYHELKHEDDPNFGRGMRQDRQIARMNANAKWAMQRLMPVYEKHGMADEHASVTDEYGFPSYAHAVSHPNFRGFVKDFIAFHTAENQKHWKQYGKASPYHWPAILRGRQGLQSLERREAYLKTKNNTPGDISEEWENREQQRMHAPHEDPMVYGGEHEEHDPYPHVSADHRHSLEKAWHEGMKHGHEHADLMAHANLHGVIDAITKMHMPMEGASHEWNAKHAAQGLEKIAQHLEYNRRFLERKYNERMKKNAADPSAGDIPF